MRYSVILPDGDLRREVWEFTLSVGSARAIIWFDSFTLATRVTRRHRWVTKSIWVRTVPRGNNTEKPAIPAQVEAEVRKYFADAISKVEIVS